MEFSTELLQHDKLQIPSEDSSKSGKLQSNAVFVDELSALKAIKSDPINLAVCQRPTDAAMHPAIHWLAKEPFEMEHRVDVKDVSHTLQNQLLSSSEIDASRANLVADIQQLANHFSKYASTSSIRLIVEALHRVPCPKFHQDNITLRLICTYIGEGTEWLENSNVNPHPDCCGGSIVLDESRVQRLNPFEVGLLKGKRWSGNTMGIYHRSPAIHNNQPRLVVKMDVAP